MCWCGGGFPSSSELGPGGFCFFLLLRQLASNQGEGRAWRRVDGGTPYFPARLGGLLGDDPVCVFWLGSGKLRWASILEAPKQWCCRR